MRKIVLFVLVVVNLILILVPVVGAVTRQGFWEKFNKVFSIPTPDTLTVFVIPMVGLSHSLSFGKHKNEIVAKLGKPDDDDSKSAAIGGYKFGDFYGKYGCYFRYHGGSAFNGELQELCFSFNDYAITEYLGKEVIVEVLTKNGTVKLSQGMRVDEVDALFNQHYKVTIEKDLRRHVSVGELGLYAQFEDDRLQHLSFYPYSVE